MKTAAFFLVLLLLTGCSAWDVAKEDDLTSGPGDSYTVELPSGWVRFRAERKTLILTRDGYTLQQIIIIKKDGKDAFPRTKKEVDETLLPSELAEIQLAEIKSANELTGNLEVLENTLATLSGKVGYKLHVRFKNSRGLPYEQLIYGFCDKNIYYAMGFAAPTLYYFDHHKAEFEQMVESFKLKKKEG
ncbi:MAG: hypothetical protein ACREV0_11210 [Burkholderiales bacterium]